jgi:hypothetical protein
LSESRRAGRKVFFDFATLPERARNAAGTDSNDPAGRFNGCGEFVAASRSAALLGTFGTGFGSKRTLASLFDSLS